MPRRKAPSRTPASKPLVVGLCMPGNKAFTHEALSRGWHLMRLTNYEVTPAGPHGVLTDCLPDNELYSKMRKKGCPVVRVGRFADTRDKTAPAVIPDLPAQGRIAAEHFHERGFAHVAFFGSDPWGNYRPVFQGLEERATELNLHVHLRRNSSSHPALDMRRSQKEQCFKSWIKELPKPLGLLATTDLFAQIYLGWLDSIGISVPDEVSVLARGESCDFCVPRISYIDLNDGGQARQACELLGQLMAGQPAPGRAILVPPAGVVERSTTARSTSDSAVALALNYMSDRLDTELTIQEIARAAHLSRRQLERRFQAAVGHSINQELRRKRLEEMKHLLRSTDLPVSDIAPMVGFRASAYVYRVFRTTFGVTPDEYRRSISPTSPSN